MWADLGGRAKGLPPHTELGSSSVSRPVAPERLRLAARAAQLIKRRAPLRDDELLTLLACEPDELQAAIGIVIRWRKADRCGDFLVAVPPLAAGRPTE